jgi:hypothetical protein
MREFNTIKELFEAVKSGKVDESKLRIVLDNDCTDFYEGEPDDFGDENWDWKNIEIEVSEANGYSDIEALYKLLFPKADVQWC